MKHLLALRFLTLLAVCFSGGETAAATPSEVPLGANEARVTGHKATLFNAVNILVAPTDKLPAAGWKSELVIPAGPNRLTVRYQSVMPGGAIGGASEFQNVVEIAFEAEAGHEYHAEMWGKSIFNMGYKITDKATGKKSWGRPRSKIRRNPKRTTPSRSIEPSKGLSHRVRPRILRPVERSPSNQGNVRLLILRFVLQPMP